MTPTEQRIAIAEACGWTGVIAGAIGAVGFPPGRVEARERRTVIPAYTEDLNAMHEAWCSLTEDQHGYFRVFIAEIVRRDGHVCGPCRSLSNATAKQRAEAFLKSLKLWKEEV